MVPALWPGESIVVRRLDGEEVESGDVVVFAREHRFVVHRVTGRSPAAPDAVLLTQGDATAHPDLPVHVADVLGVVVAVRRMHGEHAVLRRETAALRAVAWVMRRSSLAHCVLARVIMRGWQVAGRRSAGGRRLGGLPSAALRRLQKMLGIPWQNA